MADLPGQENLLHESMRCPRIRSNFRKDHLQSNPTALKQVILYLIDLTHAAPCDESDDEKPSGDPISSVESRGRRCRIRVPNPVSCGVGCCKKIDDRLFQEAASALVFH